MVSLQYKKCSGCQTAYFHSHLILCFTCKRSTCHGCVISSHCCWEAYWAPCRIQAPTMPAPRRPQENNQENGVSSQSNHYQLANQTGPPVDVNAGPAPALPMAAPGPEAPNGAHPVSCSPCWHTAKGRGCQKKACPFCHKLYVPDDVRHPGGAKRQRAAKRNAKRDNKTELPVPRR